MTDEELHLCDYNAQCHPGVYDLRVRSLNLVVLRNGSAGNEVGVIVEIEDSGPDYGGRGGDVLDD